VRTLPLIVLAYEGPSVRAYLARMRQADLRPQRVLLMVQTRHPTTKKPIGRWLPRRIRAWYAERSQEQSHNYWPRRIKADHPHLVEAITRQMRQVCRDPADLIDRMLGRLRYEDYTDHVHRVPVAGLRDPALVQALTEMSPGAVLFTGGGILPPALLEIQGIRFLHVHPGLLPLVRGADGLLWSTLLRGRPALSAFYMARDLDTGHLIAAEEYPELRFDLSGQPRPDDQALYRAIFSFYDPIMRAEFLVTRVIGEQTDLSALPAVPQDPAKGITYHFMHPTLQKKLLEHLFIGEANES